MERVMLAPRQDWQGIVQDQGLVWHTLDDATTPYWNEGVHYRFSRAQIDRLERATNALQKMYLDAGEYVIQRKLLSRFGIPEFAHPLIEQSWQEEPPALFHGRFDLAYNGFGSPKLLEYNADTPTSLLEAAVVQWAWKEDIFPKHDQFNSIHDRLVAKWTDLRQYLRGNLVHFVHVEDEAGEDTVTVAYLRDTAERAGLETNQLGIQNLGWDSASRRFVDLVDRKIDTLFHLYPWEWIVNEAYGTHVPECHNNMHWLEPIWKMMWSNKFMMTVLWELFPNNEYLLPTYTDPRGMSSFVKKPFLSREGASVTIVRDGEEVLATEGDYGEEGYVFQEFIQIPEVAPGTHPIIGSWIIDGEAAGMGIREGGLVTGNRSQFVPHIIVP